MPLLDHFRNPPDGRPWESFHSRWANSIGDHLNEILPRRYVSDIFMHFGAQVAADVAELERLDGDSEAGNGAASGGVAVQTWAAPPATATMPAVFPDDLEVHVTDERDGHRLVAVVELVSQANKDRPDARHGFAAKCAAYLQRGIGLVVIDIVITRHTNLHDELIDLLGHPETLHMPEGSLLYANAYRPVAVKEACRIDMWINGLAIGGNLPIVPLALKGGRPVPLDLEATYNEARRRARL